MQKLTVETAFGPIEWVAKPEVFDASGPLLLVIRGAFADRDSLSHLPECVEVDCALASLPGHGGLPPLVSNSVGVFAAGFREAIVKAFPDRPLVVLGMSVGGLVAMALRLPQIKRLVLVDPPLSTGKLWPMTERIREGFEGLWPHLQDFCWQVFGVNSTQAEGRDYTHLLDALAVPADVMLGGIPLEPRRDLDVIPCLNDPDAYSGHAFVSRKLIPAAGHNIPAQSPHVFLHVVREACAVVWGREGAGAHNQ